CTIEPRALASRIETGDTPQLRTTAKSAGRNAVNIKRGPARVVAPSSRPGWAIRETETVIEQGQVLVNDVVGQPPLTPPKAWVKWIASSRSDDATGGLACHVSPDQPSSTRMRF